MSREFTARMNGYGQLILDGKWTEAIREMVNDDMDRKDVKWLCDQINFYPTNDFYDYVDKVIAHKKNEEACKCISDLVK